MNNLSLHACWLIVRQGPAPSYLKEQELILATIHRYMTYAYSIMFLFCGVAHFVRIYCMQGHRR